MKDYYPAQWVTKMAVNGRAPSMFAANVTLLSLLDLLDKAVAKRGDVELLYTVARRNLFEIFGLEVQRLAHFQQA